MSLKIIQKKAGLLSDGVFGPKTFHGLKEYLNIPSDIAAVHFFAQCAHETGEFKHFEENLNYGAQGLISTFGKYFTWDEAREYERQPERIANRVYADRMGNGNEASGDGWKYRGRGAIQLTGKDNYRRMAEAFNLPMILHDPEVVALDLSFPAAMWFFTENGIFDICNDLKEETVRTVTKKINGGYNGLKHRIELTNRYKEFI